MNNIIDLFTRQVIPWPKEESDTRPYTAVVESMRARFGNDLPAHFEKCFQSPQKQPYMHGDATNVEYANKDSLFNQPMPVPSEVTIDSCRRVNKVLTLGANCKYGTDEPFPWTDNKYQVTLNFLKSLPDKTKLNVYTRSDLIAGADYMKELKRLDVIIHILYTSTNEQVNRSREPGAPSYQRRAKAAAILVSHGLNAKLVLHRRTKRKAA